MENRVVNKRDSVLNQIIEIADAGYPDGRIAAAWDPKAGRAVKATEDELGVGDGLAIFLAREIAETCEGEDLLEGLMDARHAVENAATELDALCVHLMNEERRLEEGGASSTTL